MDIDETLKMLEQGTLDVFRSYDFKKYLDSLARFPTYSVNNQILIMLQCPEATLCQSFSGWKKMNRFVKKGEKGIHILAPAPYKVKRERELIGEDGQPVIDEEGNRVTEETEVTIESYKTVCTFDISQTDGEPLPELVSELTGVVEGYDDYVEAIRSISPVAIRFADFKSSAKGYYSPNKQEIVIKRGMSEEQTIKTMLHECAHALLGHGGKDDNEGRKTHEVQAESVAYVVSTSLGLDTSDYSFPYVASWSSDKDIKELKASLNVIRDKSISMISGIKEKMETLKLEHQKYALEHSVTDDNHSMKISV